MLMFFPLARCNFLAWMLGSDFPELVRYHRWVPTVWRGCMMASSAHQCVSAAFSPRALPLQLRPYDRATTLFANVFRSALCSQVPVCSLQKSAMMLVSLALTPTRGTWHAGGWATVRSSPTPSTAWCTWPSGECAASELAARRAYMHAHALYAVSASIIARTAPARTCRKAVVAVSRPPQVPPASLWCAQRWCSRPGNCGAPHELTLPGPLSAPLCYAGCRTS